MAAEPAVHRNLVVIGASAGGVEALCEVVAGLPATLAAAVLVVLHMPAQSHSELPAILARSGRLPTAAARSGEPLRAGRIYVAVPDHHLLVKDGHALLSMAPRQNHARPAVDALFRSAARWHGPGVVGVILSGSLDDGAAGLAAINAAGGASIVQDPADALSDGMPRAALAVVPNAVAAPAAKLGALIASLVAEPVPHADPPADHDLIVETDMTENHPSLPSALQLGHPISISCPDCSGGMRQVHTDAATYYRCHIGHVWSPQSLIAAQRDKIEQALWTAVSMLEEQTEIHQSLASRAAQEQAIIAQKHQKAAAEEVRKAAQVIRKHFPELTPNVL